MRRTITVAGNEKQAAARQRASIPFEDFDPGDPELFRTYTIWPYLDRRRKEEPVRHCKDSRYFVTAVARYQWRQRSSWYLLVV
jgi:hypothetical protein